MSFNWPTPPSGSSNEASFMRRLVEGCKRTTPKAGPGLRTTETREGTIFTLASGDSTSGSTAINFGIITQLHNDDYITVRPWNPSAAGGSGDFAGGEIQVAKCLDGRMIDEKTYGDFVVAYDYTSDPPNADNVRQATADGGSPEEYQVINPRYTADDGSGTVGDIILYAQLKVSTGVTSGSGSTIFLIELQPNRRWVYQANQSGLMG